MMAPPLWVADYLAIPFLDKGRTERGCDCFGLVRLVMARRAAVVLADYGFIACRDRTTINAAIVEARADRAMWSPIPLSEAQPFDVVPMTDVVQMQDGSSDVADCHVGIIVTERHVLHTEFASGPVCLDISHHSVAHRFHPQDAPLVYRHRDLCR
jgi:hypothetical protein